MDSESAREALNGQLQALAGRRARAQDEIDRAGLEIGATATYLRDVLRQSKARSAEFAALSPSHMTELMRAAVNAGITIDDPLRKIPVLRGEALQTYVRQNGGPRRIIASFADSDTMWMAKIEPEAFLDLDDRYGGLLNVPHMLVHTREGTWVAVDNVNVGYGGTGSSNALRELQGLGLDPDMAKQVAYSRVSDVDLEDPDNGLFTNRWPHVPLGEPSPVGDFFVVVVPVEDPSARARRLGIRNVAGPRDFEQTHNGFYATWPSEPPLARWISALDDPAAPEWLSGPRRARVFLDREVARAAGFAQLTLQPWQLGSYGTYPVVIEQGRLQLWLDIPTSNDPTMLFTPEIYAALDQAGFYTDDLRARDDQSSFWRWLRSLGAVRPDFVDLDDCPLVFEPPARDTPRP